MDLRDIAGVLRTAGAASRSHFDFSLLQPTGIPRGALTEISGAHGAGKTEVVLQFLAEHTEVRTAWIEDKMTAYPVAFPQNGVALNRVLFAQAGRDPLWTAHQILRSGIFPIVVLMAGAINELELRRLQLSAEKSDSSVITLTEKPTLTRTWPIRLQLAVSRKSEDHQHRCKIEILKGPSFGNRLLHYISGERRG